MQVYLYAPGLYFDPVQQGFWAHLCNLHGGLFCVTFRLSVCVQFHNQGYKLEAHMHTKSAGSIVSTNKVEISWFRNVSPSKESMYAFHVWESKGGLYVNVKLNFFYLS